MIGAVVIGDGVRAFETPSTATLRLLDVHQLQGPENVLVCVQKLGRREEGDDLMT